MSFPRLVAISLIALLACSLIWAGPEEESADAQVRPIELADILGWKGIRSTTISDDGAWFAYLLAPQDGDAQIVARSTKSDTEHRFDAGQAPARGNVKLAFDAESKWLAFTVYPTKMEKKKAAKSKKKVHNKAVLVELATGETIEYEKVRGFDFAGERGQWIAVHNALDSSGAGSGPGNRAGGGKGKGPQGSNLVLRELDTGSELSVGNVGEFAFDKSGRLLAWTVDVAGQSGNGLQMRWMESNIVRALDSGKAFYAKLNWNDEGDGLAVLKGTESKKHEDRLYSLVAFHDFDAAAGPVRVAYDPADDSAFPSGMTLSPNRAPVWTDSLDAVLLGIHDAKTKKDKKGSGADEEEGADGPPAKGEDDPEAADLVIWHWKDRRMQSQQQVQENRDKNFSYLSTYRVADSRFLRLADDTLRNVTPAPKQQYAIGIDRAPYERLGNLDGRRYSDVYAIDMKTGARKRVLERSRWYFGPSPDGLQILSYAGGHFHVTDLATQESRNISKGAPVRFVNIEDDHNVVEPPVRPIGWSADSKSVLLSDLWDVWKVPVESGMASNLTKKGRQEQIRFRRHLELDPEAKGIDLSQPAFFTAYGEWTKKGGFGLLKPDGSFELPLWGDESFGGLKKARKADVFVYSQGDYEAYPDYRVSGPVLADATSITDANPQQPEFTWSSGVRLVDYTSDKGVKHQGALFLPANYEPGKSYPTVVYIYERLSQRLNSYASPSLRGFVSSVYNSNGYAVFMPDISYTVDDPGMSAVWCVLPGLKAAIATGVVDADRVGLHGHSWGGYQTSFLITQTDMFAAAVAGAPLTNMISMYSSIYWNTGGANQAIFESSQGRFTGGYWEVPEAYARNSPVYFAPNVQTPLLLLHNDKDGAVDWNQGIEYFNTLRRLNKPVVMLQYKGENHGLRKPPNMKDYTVRMKEFFDHHLMGKPAPEWLEKGISHLDIDEHEKQRARESGVLGRP